MRDVTRGEIRRANMTDEDSLMSIERREIVIDPWLIGSNGIFHLGLEQYKIRLKPIR